MNNIESMLTPTKAARMIRINLSGMFRELKKVVAILVTFSLIIYDINDAIAIRKVVRLNTTSKALSEWALIPVVLAAKFKAIDISINIIKVENISSLITL